MLMIVQPIEFLRGVVRSNFGRQKMIMRLIRHRPYGTA
jgi:hypothetical protein